MTIITWITIGLAVGVVAALVLRVRFPGGIAGAAFAGSLGALLGAFAFVLFVKGALVFGFASTLAAFVGAVVLLVALLLSEYAATVEVKRAAPAPRRTRRR